MIRAWSLLLLASTVAGCSAESPVTGIVGTPTTRKPTTEPENVDVRIPTARYAWDPKAGDPAVSAELGGPGFTGDRWSTRMESYQLGNPEAPQGGTMVLDLPDWPSTLRQAGPDWNTTLNHFVGPLLFMPLVDLDPVSLDFVPSLATHWWMSPDRRTYRFRINPEAKWSDGMPVTAEDVIASYELRTDPSLLDPSNLDTFGRMFPPVALSKYVVEVQVREENWHNFLYFATAPILPAHEIGGLTGTQYNDRYEFAYPSVTGPYQVKPEDIDSGTSIVISRRTDWWGENNPQWDGWYNIEKFKYIVIRDPQLRFEKVKKGELDYIFVQKAQWWAEDIPSLDAVRRGLLIRRKFFTDTPIGLSGLALNTARPPLDDVRIRKSLQLLLDRRTLIDKVFFREYEPLASYFPGGMYANPSLEPVLYDEAAAIQLLEEAGWTEKNAEGYRVDQGRELTLTITYSEPLSERWLSEYAIACKRAGIRIDLQQLPRATAYENFWDREYQVYDAVWGGLLFPNPETSWHSRFAAGHTNNVTGMTDVQVDGWCNRYEREYDLAKRVEYIRQLDAELTAEAPYVLGWYNPSQRVLFWNKFGMPAWGTARAYRAEYDDLFVLWWIDPEKEKQLEEARTDLSITMDPGREEVRFWQAWSVKHATSSGPGLPQ